MTIKGIKKIEIKGVEIRKKSRDFFMSFPVRKFFFLISFAQEACSLKLGQPWLRQAIN